MLYHDSKQPDCEYDKRNITFIQVVIATVKQTEYNSHLCRDSHRKTNGT